MVGVNGKSGCRELGKCCQGKSNDCRGMRPEESKDAKKVELKLNKISKVKLNATCFCDSACVSLHDCCYDYQDYCKPVDCVVSNVWDEWGECGTRCGTGIKQRIRKVLQEPLNAGQPCPHLIEKIPCEGHNCKIARAPEGYDQLRETAKIIPAAFGRWRESKLYHPFKDIRKNLFDYYETKNRVVRPAYCTIFEVTEAHNACKQQGKRDEEGERATLAEGLVKGARVCVDCQELAMKKKLGSRCKGDGSQGKDTRWNAVMLPGCHGKWKMVSRQEECSCVANRAQVTQNQSSFILL